MPTTTKVNADDLRRQAAEAIRKGKELEEQAAKVEAMRPGRKKVEAVADLQNDLDMLHESMSDLSEQMNLDVNNVLKEVKGIKDRLDLLIPTQGEVDAARESPIASGGMSQMPNGIVMPPLPQYPSEPEWKTQLDAKNAKMKKYIIIGAIVLVVFIIALALGL